MPNPIEITPNCRYGHGDLRRIRTPHNVDEWGVMSDKMTGAGLVGFNLELYVCPSCGYAEFRDGDVERTMKEEPLA